jgi:enhanced disease susceptibility 1 protein
LPNEIPESCFWAEVEELCIKAGCQGTIESILHLKTKVDKWIQNEELGGDVLLENSTFTKLQKQHFLTN